MLIHSNEQSTQKFYAIHPIAGIHTLRSKQNGRKEGRWEEGKQYAACQVIKPNKSQYKREEGKYCWNGK